MASMLPPTDAEQLKTLLAQYDKRLRVRLGIWGAVAGVSLVAAVLVSLTGTGSTRLQTALFGSSAIPDIPVATAVPLPSAELIALTRATEAVKRANDLTVTKMARVERTTDATRAEIQRLSEQLNKLSVDSLRFTGRLANIEQQIGTITGSIKQQAEKAANDAVAKALPAKPAYDAFNSPAPIISPPVTTPPRLSLLMPPGSLGTPDNITTSAIKTPTEGKAGMQAKPGAKMTDRVPHGGELKAEVGVQPKNDGSRQTMSLTRQAEAKSMAMRKSAAKPSPKTAKPAIKMASAAPTPHRRVNPSWSSPRRGYGVDLGGADSVTIVNAQWAAVKANFGPVLAGMRPIAVRNHRILTSGSYRLVVGRLHSRAAAKRLCERLARAHMACEPVEFEGEKIVWQ